MTKKQKDIFDAGKKLFLKFGIRKVTVDEICEEANVSKMTFYKYFPNKIELAKSVLDNYFSYWIDRYEELMKSELPSEVKMTKTFELKLEAALNIEMDFLLDLYKYPNEDLKEHFGYWQQKSFELTKSWFVEMQDSGLIIKELNFDLFMLYSNAIKDFATNEKTMEMLDRTQELTDLVTKLYMYGISERKDKEN